MKNNWRITFGICLLSFVIYLNSDAEITDKDIIAQYTFDEGTKASDAIDISGNGHNGKFVEGANRKPGKFDMGAHFDADKATQAIRIDDHDDLNVTKELSVVAWVKWLPATACAKWLPVAACAKWLSVSSGCPQDDPRMTLG